MSHNPQHTRRRSIARGVLASVSVVALGVGLAAAAAAPASARAERAADGSNPRSLTGTLTDGSAYRIDLPETFNGTLLVYSHGLVPPGQPNPPTIAPDPATAAALLDRGYALAGTAFGTGFAVEQGLRDQAELTTTVARKAVKPQRTLAWGQSMGGLMTAELLERRPDLYAGALPMCGLLAGSNGLWNTYLDLMFTLKTLLDPSLTLVNDKDPFTTAAKAIQAIHEAQSSPRGRARVALAAAMADLPGWAGAGTQRPAPADVDAQEQAQAQTLSDLVVVLATAARSEMELHAGGNPSNNVAVDYGQQLARSTDRAEVLALYAAAGTGLVADLKALATAPRVPAVSTALQYLRSFASFTGNLHGRPVVTLHDTGDGAAAPEHEQAYAAKVRAAGDSSLLRQLFVERAGHCTFTPAEMVASVQLLDQRVRTGSFGSTTPEAMGQRAAALGQELNGVVLDDGQFIPVPPGFASYQPGRFLRPGQA